MLSRRYWVLGRVQGVFFRASTAAQAQVLGIRGFARNHADGRVEVLAVGEVDMLDALEEWLHQGPELARVEKVVREEMNHLPDSISGFQVL